MLQSKDIKCMPLGSKMIVRAYLKPQSIILGLDSKEIVPCVEIMKVGPDVKHLKPGMEVELPNRAMVQILPKLDGLSEYATCLSTEVIGIYKDGK